MNNGLIFTNENCIGCNKCVRICCSFGASVSHNRPDHSSIFINPERCIGCGACIDVCTHGARNYHDDTEQFFSDLSKGESISLLIAPAFEARYPKEYKKILGALKSLGVRKMLSVAFQKTAVTRKAGSPKVAVHVADYNGVFSLFSKRMDK